MLTSQKLISWELFLRSHAAITRQLDVLLQRNSGITLRDYEVLLRLYRAPDHGIRMSDLAAQVALTPSGMTRLIAGLRTDGMVDRVRCESDSRVTWITLTDDGRRRFETIRERHLADVERLFVGRFTDEQRDALSELLDLLPRSVADCDSMCSESRRLEQRAD